MPQEAWCEDQAGSLYAGERNEGRGCTWVSGGRQCERNLVSLAGTLAPDKKKGRHHALIRPYLYFPEPKFTLHMSHKECQYLQNITNNCFVFFYCLKHFNMLML